jgi:flagellar assembly factor FliW
MRSSPTKYWGEMEYGDDAVVHFPQGLYGFEAHGEFILINQKGLEPLVFLQSLQDGALCFPALPVRSVCADYKIEMQAEDLQALGLSRSAEPGIGDDLACLAILRVAEGGSCTANLLAPLVISLKTGRGVQAIVNGSTYSHQHPIEVPARCSS